MLRVWACYLLAFIGLIATVDGQCNGIELTVDKQPFSKTVLYKPLGSSGIFVTCQKCDDNINKPSWHSLITQNRIAGCSKTHDGVCASKPDAKSRGLRFSNFTSSLAGLYECRMSGGITSSVNISVLDPPVIITSPMNHVKRAQSTPNTLTCEATSYDGQVLYHWEKKGFQETEWTVLNEKRSDGNSYTTYTTISEQYRCVASNEAGETRSRIANVTILTSTINPKNKLVPVGGAFSLTCKSSVSSVTMFAWTRDRMPVSGQSSSNGDTSTLTLSNVRMEDSGGYVCTVKVGTLVVMSDTVVVTAVIIDPPQITEHPVGGDIPIGMNVTLNCNATGLGLLKFAWQRYDVGNWATISTDSTTSYTATASGLYRCRVSNEAGAVESNRTRVNIYGPPTITTQPATQLSTIGMSVNLNCEGNGSGLLTYHWEEHERGNGWKIISGSNDSTLIVRNIQKSSRFRCTVSNEAGSTTSHRVIISILEIITHPQIKLVAVRSRINFTCTSSVSSNVTFSWTHNGTSISGSSTTGDTSILTITSVRNSDAGSYVCTVSSGSLSVMSNTATLTVYVAPVITDDPAGDDVPTGENVTLTCRASGVGTLVYSWERSSGSSWTTVSNDNTTSYTTDTTLAIGQYMYRCRVSNDAGSIVSNVAIVNVYGPPTITIHPTSQLTNISMGVTLDCEGTGRGSITYQWETSNNNGGQWMNISDSNSKTLVVRNLEQSQQYRCVVSNEAGSNRSDVATVTVLKIITHPQAKIVPINSTVSLTCKSSISSNVTFSWTHNGASISGSSTTGDTSILTITSVRNSDAGSYVCTVKSGSLSVMSNTATLTVYGSPVITTHPTSANIPIGNNVTLECRASGQAPMKYIWEARNDNSNWYVADTSNTTSFTVRGRADGSFMYRCKVENQAGLVMSEEATVIVFGPPEINPLQPQFHAELDRQFQINCTATNVRDATENLMFSWTGPSGVHFNVTTTTEDDSRTATSTLHIDTITHRHGGVYQCTVSNGGVLNDTTLSEIIVQVHPTRPREFNIISEDIYSITLRWTDPAHTHGPIDHYNLYYNSTEHKDKMFNKTVDPQNHTYILTGLKPYTGYSIYLTAVRMIGIPMRPLEGRKSRTVTGKTLAGKPVIGPELELPEWIINSDYSTSNVVSLPTITTENGPFSYLYVIVYTIGNTTLVTDVEDITTQEILEETTRTFPLFYVTAVIDASQYRDGYTMKYALGAGDTTTDNYGNAFHNREIKTSTLFFFRVFSISSTQEREISTTTSMQTLVVGEGISVNTDDSENSDFNILPIIVGVVIALIIIIILVLLILLFLAYRKRSKRVEPVTKMTKTKSSSTITTIGSSPDVGRETCTYVVPTSGGSDTDSNSINPVFKIKMESSGVRSSVGQPTTLMIALPDIHRPTITWKKDGQQVNHPVLSDGSLYIVNTSLSDQGRYIVTVSSDGSTESATIQLTVINPQMPTDHVKHKPVKVDKLAKHLASLKADDSGKLEAEFEAVSYDPVASQHAAKLICNISKNRFTNIMPYDHSRVVLNHQDHLTGSDYINASFIDGYAKGRAYIAAQGPLNNTVDDFWRMIWEQNVTTIVMLTRLVEDAKIKCCQYWPNEGGSTDYGSVRVTLQKEDQLANYCVRQLLIRKGPNNTNESRVVYQFHFTTWPDHGVPDHPTVMLDFLQIINRYHVHNPTSPILVHCSAGVGRTGTLIAIDSEIERIKLRNVVNIFECVCKMRYHRDHMVQTPEQYEFIHAALLEHITCGNTTLAGPLDNLKNKIEELCNVIPSNRKSKLQMQFEKLSSVSCSERDFTYTAAKSSPTRNRVTAFLPPDSARISLLRFHGSSDYINACFIDGYHKRKAFLVGPGPLQSTATDLWTMIWEKKSYVVVMLGQLKENGENVSSEYWNKSESGDFVVETQSEKKLNEDIVQRIIRVTNTTEGVTRTITQLQYVEWSQNRCPSNPTPMVDLVKVLEDVQHKTSNGPITVQCSDGVSRSGTFCALMVCINRFRTEKIVDVFRTIQIMRGQRPGIVGNVDQYEFIHKALVSVLQQSSS